MCPLCSYIQSTQGGLERPKFRRKRLSPVESLSAAASEASAQPPTEQVSAAAAGAPESTPVPGSCPGTGTRRRGPAQLTML